MLIVQLVLFGTDCQPFVPLRDGQDSPIMDFADGIRSGSGNQ
jgi:hypothetical protein